MKKGIWIVGAIVTVVLAIAVSQFVQISRERKNTEIKIGVVLPLSGEGAKYGTTARQAIDLVFSEVNKRGGVRNRTISAIYEDSKGVGKDGVSALQKLITVDHVSAVIGGLFSSVTLAMAPVAERNRVVVLSPTSSAPSITNAGDYIFRNCASDVFEGSVMADAAIQELGIKKTAVVYVNNDYGVGIVGVFKKTFTDHGGQIVAEEAFPQGATDFRSHLTKIIAAEPNGVYIVGYKELGLLLKQARELGLATQFMSSVMFEDPEVLTIAGDAAEGVIYSARAYDPRSNEPHVIEFVTTFEDQYQSDPDIFAAYAYDAARILVQAIRQGGMSSDAIRDAIYSINNFAGVTGSTSFDENGDVIQPAYLKTVHNGQFIWYR